MNLDLDEYAEWSSPVHSWSPPLKILGLVVLIFTLGAATSINTSLAGFALAVLIFVASRLPLKLVFVRLRVVFAFIAFTALALMFTSGGEILYESGFLRIYSSGARLSVLIGLKASGITLLAITMMATSRFHETAAALGRLHVPGPLVQLVMFTYRFFFVAHGEMRSMKTAFELRGYRKRSALKRLAAVGSFVGVMLFRGFERAERTYAAMSLKGYDGRLRSLDDARPRTLDFLKTAVAMVLSSGLVVMEVIS